MPSLAYLSRHCCTRLFPSGAWQVSALIGEGYNARLVTRTYYGYTKRDAVRLYRSERAQ